MKENKLLSKLKLKGITPFENKVWLSSPTMNGSEFIRIILKIQGIFVEYNEK